mmetsp:Transcript_20135/g.30858  ORF Transcript_20135/g.30858 Transcript_20135/m.30858 type:complete len:80 (-) Transcript_20135:157-396(-)
MKVIGGLDCSDGGNFLNKGPVLLQAEFPYWNGAFQFDMVSILTIKLFYSYNRDAVTRYLAGQLKILVHFKGTAHGTVEL